MEDQLVDYLSLSGKELGFLINNEDDLLAFSTLTLTMQQISSIFQGVRNVALSTQVSILDQNKLVY